MSKEKLEHFVDYLVSSKSNCSELTKFMALDCLKEFSVISIYVGMIKEDGYIHRIGGFGLEELVVGNWEKIPLDIDLPITRAVKTSRYQYIDDKRTLTKDFNYSRYLSLPKLAWNSCLVIPYIPNGIIFIGFKSKINFDDDLLKFLEISLKLIIYSQSVIHGVGRNIDNINFNKDHKNSSVFSNRQTLILDMLKKGLTNSQIANELGYSESLIRQETVKIFRNLNVSGRKQIIELADTE